MTNAEATAICTTLGLEYHGAKMYPDRRRGGQEVLLHFISDPATRATFNLADDQLSAETVAEALDRSRATFTARA